jgi:hypothetical protein
VELDSYIRDLDSLRKEMKALSEAKEEERKQLDKEIKHLQNRF